MKPEFKVIVLCGGVSEESAVSRVSGQHVAEALSRHFRVELVALLENALPVDLDPEHAVVFPAMHGDFGEDGELQGMLEAGGLAYAGSGPAASALCMNKAASKKAVAGSGFAQARDFTFRADSPPEAAQLMAQVGSSLVIKPLDKGSSVGLHFVEKEGSFEALLKTLPGGDWMAEERIFGREMTVGILHGRALGIVEIVPSGGVYDYQHKYTAGATEYRFPAQMEPDQAKDIRLFAENAFRLCGCRDFGRVDFILAADGRPYFLEINTIPGLTPTSLLPKSASCYGYDFIALAKEMILPAVERFTVSPQPL